jgi:WD40 repeat protein
MMWARWRQRWVACGGVALLVCLAACAGTSGGSTAAHTLPVTPQPAIALTFYENEAGEGPEAFTPFLVSNGPAHSVVSFGFSQQEGAYYIASYDADWHERDISNGFQPSDPKWDCDDAYNTSVIAPDVTLVARPCVDGSISFFAETTATVLFRLPGTPGVVSLSARIPSAAFAPVGHVVAITNDGPAGPGQSITLYDTQTWMQGLTLDAAAGLLSQPSWSADGTKLAAVTLDGTLHIWDASSGAEVAHVTIPQFTQGSAASDPAGPAPQWSPDGTSLLVTTPAATGTALTMWAVQGTTLVPHASATIAAMPNTVNPQMSPDGQHIFVHTTALHGQIFTASDLRQVSDFGLVGNLVLWTDARHLAVFTTQASVVPMKVG